ncbi:cAMP-binding protein CbpA [Simiduia litorea]|uniref:Crp/Fnr family transcriptional regulator n=1 Tax=Simiduia litorea TaxID=1435348 RepID=UPI0036F1FA86
MYLSDNDSAQISDLSSKLKGLTELLLKDCPQGETLSVPHSADLFDTRPASQLLLMTSGSVHLEHQGNEVVQYETGDLLGLSRSLQLPEGKLVANQASFISINRDDLIAHVNASAELQKHWAYYLICLCTYFKQALTQEKRGQFQPSTGFLSFSEGETIIAQGDTADCVYTLLEGTAMATRDGIKVGDVKRDEIFGALAVFTRQARNASVIATSDCSVMAVRKEDFIDLVEHQPQICIGLIEEMADKINQLNQQIAARH